MRDVMIRSAGSHAYPAHGDVFRGTPFQGASSASSEQTVLGWRVGAEPISSYWGAECYCLVHGLVCLVLRVSKEGKHSRVLIVSVAL